MMSSRVPRRPTPSGGVAGRTVVVVVVAALLGWLILSRAYRSSSSSVSPPKATTTTTIKGGSTTTTSAFATTTTTVNMTGVKVIVLNGSGVAGAAGKLTQQLQQRHLVMQSAKDATGSDFSATAVYYTVGFDKQAAFVAETIKPGLLTAGIVPAQSPAKNPADLTGVGVVVLLGKDLATDVVNGKIPPADTSNTTSPTSLPGGTVASTAKPTTTSSVAKTTTTVKKTTTTKKK
jgi:LytR cell envelope-related transcriptional attenuator